MSSLVQKITKEELEKMTPEQRAQTLHDEKAAALRTLVELVGAIGLLIFMWIMIRR